MTARYYLKWGKGGVVGPQGNVRKQNNEFDCRTRDWETGISFV